MFSKGWVIPLSVSLSIVTDRNREYNLHSKDVQRGIHKFTFHSGHLNLIISCRRRRSSSLRLQSSLNSTDVDNSSASADGSSSSACVHLVWSAVVVGGEDPANWSPSACWSSGILLSSSPLICWRLAGGSASSGLEWSTDEGVLTVATSYDIRYTYSQAHIASKLQKLDMIITTGRMTLCTKPSTARLSVSRLPTIVERSNKAQQCITDVGVCKLTRFLWKCLI